MSNSAYDIYLGDKANPRGYRLRSLVRDSAPQVAPRFSSGAAGQTDLDLLKSASVDNFSGGMFQRDWIDPTRVARSIGIFNKNDENLYPAPPRSSVVTSGVAGGYPKEKAERNSVAFLANANFSAGTYYNSLRKITAGGGYVTVALPVALQSNGFANITSLCLHKKYLFVGSRTASGGQTDHRYDITAGTWQDLTGLSVKFFTIRGQLYSINYLSQVHVVTNEEIAGAPTYTTVDTAGSSELNDICTSVTEFNGAAWITKPDGIFRFDGVKAVRVLKHVTTSMQEFNGALYFYSGDWLYRFDGTNLSRVQFFGRSEAIARLGMTATDDFLYIQTVVITTGYTQNDKTSTASGLRRIYAYDGATFTLISEKDETLTTYSSALLCNNTNLYDFWSTFSFTAWDYADYQTINTSTYFSSTDVTTNSKLEVTTSEFDDGFPNIFKSLEEIQPNYSGMISGDSIVVKYQYYDGRTWSSWVTAGTLTSTSANSIEITDFNSKLFKRLKVNVTATLAAGSTLALKGVAIRHTLQPRARWRWQVGILAYGAQGNLRDRNEAAITDDANALNNYITQTIKQKTPSFMFSPDYGIVKTTVNSAALSFVIKGQIPIYTDPYNEYPLCAVKNASGTWEILRVSTISYNSGTDETTVTVLERGYLGITAASINANAEFHCAYKVYVNRLLRDATILDENTFAEQATTGESQLQREFQLELVEV